MRVWRMLKALGAAVLRDGVYLLPDRPELKEALETQMLEAGAESALVLVTALSSQGNDRDAEFVQLFDRRENYAEIIATAAALMDQMSSDDEVMCARGCDNSARAWKAYRSGLFSGLGKSRGRACHGGVASRVQP